jgi:hypothetical protein
MIAVVPCILLLGHKVFLLSLLKSDSNTSERIGFQVSESAILRCHQRIC